MSFRFYRDNYDADHIQNENENIRQLTFRLLDEKNIVSSRIFRPSRNSVKVMFATDEDVNKVMKNSNYFIESGLHPRLSMGLKASRTIFCTGFDNAIFRYTSREMQNHLENQAWEIAGIYFMKKVRAIKIEFLSKHMAEKFLKNVNTNILGITLLQEHKEREVDPIIKQCWECGMINPDHSSKCCPNGPPICLKCGSKEHKFFECSIPRRRDELNNQHKQAQYCASCRVKEDHTTLDYSYCPTRREIIRERARVAREKSKKENEGNERDLNLIKSVFEFSNYKTWPALQTKQQITTSALISMALMDEAVSPGSFQKNLKKGCEDNGLPVIKYTPGKNTAREFFNNLCGVGTSGATVMQGGTHQSGAQTQGQGGAIPRTYYTEEVGGQLGVSKAPQLSKYCRDQLRGGKKARQIHQEWLEGSDHSATDTDKKVNNKDKPYQIRINTKQNTDRTSRNRDGAEGGHAPEILRSVQKSPIDTVGIRSLLDLDDTDVQSSLDSEVNINISHLPDSYYNITDIQDVGEWDDMEDGHSETDYSIMQTQSQLLDDAVNQLKLGNKEAAFGLFREYGKMGKKM